MNTPGIIFSCHCRQILYHVKSYNSLWYNQLNGYRALNRNNYHISQTTNTHTSVNSIYNKLFIYPYQVGNK